MAQLSRADAAAEMAAVHRWAEAKFAGRSELLAPETNLLLRMKPGTLARKNIQGHPFLIAGQSFADGIAMRATGEIRIEAPTGVSRLQAVVGVDSNDIGYYSNAGRGSVVASVVNGAQELYRSPVLHEGMQGMALDVDLHGAREFTIRLESVGTRSATYQAEWDQADWANAQLVLVNGARQRLSELQIGPLPEQESTEPPFSFQLGGRPSAEFLRGWQVSREAHAIDDKRTQYTFQYTDGRSRLSVRGVGIAYQDFASVEWTLYFKNESTSPSEVIENVRPIDVEFERGSEANVAVHHAMGSMSTAFDFQPLTTPLTPGSKQRFSSKGGRPSDGDMPYFNLEWPHRGIIAAMGWPGQWDLTLSRESPQRVRIAGGQSGTHFRLMPGEEVRTPLVVVQFWAGDWVDGQNAWRQWMVAHNVPRTGGQLPPPQTAAGSAHFTIEMQEANEENQKRFLAGFLDRGGRADYWWMDAGWYPYQKNWSRVGTWEVDPERFPNGLKPITDLAHERGMKSILWFEPERVAEGSWLEKNHPDWLIGAPGQDKLLYLGNKDALRWLVDHIAGLLNAQGIDTYRQDFNFEPLSRWQTNDAPDRQGISEIKHVEGYLAFFDELRRRFPKLLIDTCASGGRRLDLETLRRAVPLWRSDYPFGTAPMQMQTYGLAQWVPYFGTAAGALDKYTFRSQITPAIGIDMNPKLTSEQLAVQSGLLADWREVASFYYGNFYPLTGYTDDEGAWMAWQWGGTDGRAGVVQAFRREKSAFTSASFQLRGLKEDTQYTVMNLDTKEQTQSSGKELMEKGVPVTIRDMPGAVILKYYELRSVASGKGPGGEASRRGF